MTEEKIIFTGSPSVLTRFGSLFLGLLILLGAAVAAIILRDRPPLGIVFGALAVLALIYLLAVTMLVKATQYEVTNERLRVRRGLLTKRTDELELYRANDTSLIEPLSLRMLGLGTIEIRCADPSTPIVYLHAVHGARKLREELRQAIEDCRDRKKVRVTEFDRPDQSAQ